MPETEPPPVVLLDWPDPEPILPLDLFRLPPDREAELRERLPTPRGSAWETARSLLGWVSGRWEHDNNHVDSHDAVEILDRVEAGERFACDEYATLLCQGLNALGIPSRWAGLYRVEYHAGHSAAHSVSEAWIDEFRRWVVLDGQNGAYWARPDGEPLGVVELQQEYARSRDRSLELTCLAAPLSAEDQDFWWQYFAHASTRGSTELAWESGEFGPIFQGRFVRAADRLLRRSTHAYPDLATVWIGVAGEATAPTVTLHTNHPFPRGFAIVNERGRMEVGIGAPVPLDQTPGEHRAQLVLRTGYAELPVGRLTYRVAGP